MPKHLFLLELQKAAGTPAVALFVNNIHMYNPAITEKMPVLVRSFVITTTDLTTARTVTISLYTPHGDQLQIYDVTPNLDNNVIELTPYYKIEDGATAGTDGVTGTLDKGYLLTPYTELRFTWSDAISAADTSTWLITYEAYEKLDWRDTAGITTALRHLDLGRIE